MTDVTTLLAGIKTREEAATPSPWKADTGVRGDCVVWGPNGRFLMNMQAEPHWLEYPGETRKVSFDVDARDAAFIAAARTDVPRLIQTIEAVAKVHEPVDALMNPGRHERVVKVCTGCGSDDGNWQRWPCPTITAITAALGGGV